MHMTDSTAIQPAEQAASPWPANVRVLNLDDINLHGGTQTRVEIDNQLINEYRDAIREGCLLPPAIVFYDGTVYWMADGFHRWHAHRQANLTIIECEIRQGTQRDAIFYSISANNAHGKRRTNADKRRAVTIMLRDAEWSQWSDSLIANKCGVSHTFVGDVRGQLATDASSAPRIGKDGKKRKLPKKRTAKLIKSKQSKPDASLHVAADTIVEPPESTVIESAASQQIDTSEPQQPIVNEAQKRELAKVPEQARPRVLELAKEAAGDGQVTAEIIRDAAQDLRHRRPSLMEDDPDDADRDVAGDNVDHRDDAGDEDIDDRAAGDKDSNDKSKWGRPNPGWDKTEQFALQCAKVAITQIEQIKKTNPGREAAFVAVENWIHGQRGTDDLDPLVRAWMARTSMSATVAATILEGIAKKLRAEEGQT
jgi:ParB-like chromosome segregation protein Spo0J